MGNKNKDSRHQAVGKKKRGFSLLRKKEDGTFFFRFYNEEGELLLTSPPFPDEDKRKSSLKLIRQNAANLARFKRLTEDDLHYFVIRAGNNKSLAKSIGFDSKEALEKAINQLHRAVIDKQPDVSKTAAPAVSKKNHTLSHTNTQAAEGQSRFNFDLTFYLQEKGEKLIGKIEYPLDKEKVSFEGFDMQQIEAFILEHLPVQIKTAHVTKDSAEQASPKAKVNKKTIEKTHLPVQPAAPQSAKAPPIPVERQSMKEGSLKAIAKTDNLDLVMIEKGQVVTKNIVHKSAAISFQIAVPKEFRDPNYQIEIAVHAKLMKGGSRLVFIGKKQTFPSSLKIEHVRVPLTIYSLSPGVHRCIVNVTFIHPDSPSKNRLLVGKKLVKIVEKESFLELALN